MISKETKNIHGLLLFFGIHEFFFCLDTKETKNIHGLLLFSGIHDSSISNMKIKRAVPAFSVEILSLIFVKYKGSMKNVDLKCVENFEITFLL